MLDDLDLNQYAAALPIYEGKICLITNRTGKQWIIPKGTPEPNKPLAQIALTEAWEEAGVIGYLSPEPIGTFLYRKSGLIRCVLTWVLQVTEVFDVWPEDYLRDRRWETPNDAVNFIKNKGICDLIRQLPEWGEEDH